MSTWVAAAAVAGSFLTATMSGTAMASEVPAGVTAATEGTSETGVQAAISTVPEGYVGYKSYMTPKECETRGQRGITEGTWSAYVCEPIRLGVEMPLYFYGLYVKK
ncbi:MULTISPECIES: hypothetical protein [unclassified Streptomyces]|uniref:hypothetical protein n=1 Tax=Streptomyces sp. NPDC023588 TaxID=3154907 RepID=UPI0033F0260D